MPGIGGFGLNLSALGHDVMAFFATDVICTIMLTSKTKIERQEK